MPHQPFKSRIIGLGGAGVNALQQLISEGASAADVIAANTDVQSLSVSSAGIKIQLGRRVSRGLGAGGDPEIGMAAAEESTDEIRNAVRGCNLVILAVGLGGGTGSGAAPVIARAIAESGSYVVAIVTMPFHFEGRRRAKQASDALGALRAAAHAVIVFENDRMGEPLGPQAGVQEAFANADITISRAVLALITIACRESLIQLSLDEIFKAVELKDSRCLFGFGLSDSKDRALDALEQALQNPLMDRGLLLEHCENLVVQVNGGSEMRLIEVQDLMEALGRLIGENTQVLFGLGADPSLGGCISVIILGSVPEAEYTRRRQLLQQTGADERNLRTPAIRAQQTHPPTSFTAEPTPPPLSAATPPAALSYPKAVSNQSRPGEKPPTISPLGSPQTAPAMRRIHRQNPLPTPTARSQHPPLFAENELQEPEPHFPRPEKEDQRPPEEIQETQPEAVSTPDSQLEDRAENNDATDKSAGDSEILHATQGALDLKRSVAASMPQPEASAHPRAPIGIQNTISALVKKFSSPHSERPKLPETPSTSTKPQAPEDPPHQQQSAHSAPEFLDVDEEKLAQRGAARVVRPRSETAQAKQEFLQFDQGTTRGRFEKSAPTIIDGQDLDIPTFMRQNKKP